MLTAAAVTAACLALGTLLQTGRWRDARALTVYVAFVASAGLASVAMPALATVTAFVVQESAVSVLRFGVGFELARHVARELPGARVRIFGAALVALVVTLGLLVWGALEPSGPRSTFRALALSASGAGLLLLALRLMAFRYYLDLSYVQRATTPLGAYLITHGLLLGAITEWPGGHEMLAAALSGALWCTWALWLALSAWAAHADNAQEHHA